jgi:hypothetical protein
MFGPFAIFQVISPGNLRRDEIIIPIAVLSREMKLMNIECSRDPFQTLKTLQQEPFHIAPLHSLSR